MGAESSTVSAGPETGAGYAPYGQLVKMLLPSSGSIAIYDAAGELLWCSDGCERPDLRALLEELRASNHESLAGRGSLVESAASTPAFVAPLRAKDGRPLGSFVLEVGADGRRTSGSMVTSFVRPVLECLEAHMSLESTATHVTQEGAGGLERLLADERTSEDASSLEVLLRQCVAELGCVSGAMVLPEAAVTLSCSRDPRFDGPKLLERTQKHLLAWVQINNRPMIVNRVGANAGPAPYKILSCPLRPPEGQGVGVLALFRAPEAPDFELRDVRILELAGRKALGVLASEHDSLTGLPNGSIFQRRAQLLLDAAPAARHVLLFLDIDRLAAINDAFGLQAGDEVIQRCGDVLRSMLEPRDLATRIDGDRFVALLVQRELAAGRELAERLRSAIAQIDCLRNGVPVTVSVSIGIVEVRAGTKLAHARAAAELACKRAKQGGRNRLEELAGESSGAPLAVQEQEVAAASLVEAVGANRFCLEAQPIVGLRSRPGQLIGVELLVRLRGEANELIAPDKFLAAAERYRLMPAIDRWVLANAAEQLRAAGEDARSLGAIAVKVSDQSLLDGRYAAFALEQIARSGLPPSTFCFELKEAAAARELDAAEALVRELTAAGCRVTLEDVGGALGSIAHLKRLPVQYLKIDGRYVRRMREEPIAESLVGAVVTVARTLGMETIAAHVETAELARQLRELHVAFGQGYFLGRPVPFEPGGEGALGAQLRRAGP